MAALRSKSNGAMNGTHSHRGEMRWAVAAEEEDALKTTNHF